VKYEIMDEDDHIRVAFEGEIDLESSEEVRRVLVGAVTRSELTVVDLSAVTAIDSSGVAGLPGRPLDGAEAWKQAGLEYAERAGVTCIEPCPTRHGVFVC